MAHTEIDPAGAVVWVAMTADHEGAWVAAVSRDESDAMDAAQEAADPDNEHQWTWTDDGVGTAPDTDITLHVQKATVR